MLRLPWQVLLRVLGTIVFGRSSQQVSSSSLDLADAESATSKTH